MIGTNLDRASHIISTVSGRSLAVVPNYGKIKAALFLIGLLGETYVKLKLSDKKGWIIQTEGKDYVVESLKLVIRLKEIQFMAGISGSGYSWKFTIPAGVGFFFMPSQIAAESRITKNWVAEVISTDRPLLNTYFACAHEILNIVSKVIQSIATGALAQKMWSGQTYGKIRVVITTALLALSAVNVYNIKADR